MSLRNLIISITTVHQKKESNKKPVFNVDHTFSVVLLWFLHCWCIYCQQL